MSQKIIFSVAFLVRINRLSLPNHSEAFSDEFLRRPKPPGLALRPARKRYMLARVTNECT